MSVSPRIMRSYEIMTEQLSLMRALYVVCVATHGERDAIDAEFRQAIGDIMNGIPLEKLSFIHIDRDEISKELK